MTRLFSILAIVAASTPAAAGPGFITLDRQDGSSFGGGELSYFFLDADNATALRFDLHGQYVDPASGFGGYLAVPIGHFSVDDPLFDIDATGVGNISLGGIYVPRMRSRDFGMIVHAGLTAPTASDNAEDSLAVLATGSARLADYYLGIPEGVVMRFGVSPLFRSGQVFARIDAGADIVLSAAGTDPDPLLRLDAGIGIDLGSAALTGELANIFYTGEGSDDDALTTLAIGFRGYAGTVAPYAALVFPLDDEFDGIDAIVTVGLDVMVR
jgi:hypothetical protein